MDFLNEVAKEFEGKCEIGEDILIIRFQDDRLQLFNDTPISIVVQYSKNTATCRLFAYVRADIEAEAGRVYELCNKLNSQAGNYIRYYLNDENDVMVELNYCAFVDDVFTRVITPGMVARIAKAVDESYIAFHNLTNS